MLPAKETKKALSSLFNPFVPETNYKELNTPLPLLPCKAMAVHDKTPNGAMQQKKPWYPLSSRFVSTYPTLLPLSGSLSPTLDFYRRPGKAYRRKAAIPRRPARPAPDRAAALPAPAVAMGEVEDEPGDEAVAEEPPAPPAPGPLGPTAPPVPRGTLAEAAVVG